MCCTYARGTGRPLWKSAGQKRTRNPEGPGGMLRAASFRPGTSRRLYWNGRSDRGRLEDLSQSQQIGLRVFRQSLILKRRDVRVVEGARLESVCRGNSTVGSNPTLSARFSRGRKVQVPSQFPPSIVCRRCASTTRKYIRRPYSTLKAIRQRFNKGLADPKSVASSDEDTRFATTNHGTAVTITQTFGDRARSRDARSRDRGPVAHRYTEKSARILG